MEDSGIDSEDKIGSNSFLYLNENEDECDTKNYLRAQSDFHHHSADSCDINNDEAQNMNKMDNFEVRFKSFYNVERNLGIEKAPEENSPAKVSGELSANTVISKDNENSDISKNHLSTCRILQRKLELKVERAKRNYNQFQEENARKIKSSSANLIPISRLAIPRNSEHQPLVDYKSESDDAEEISFFPSKLKQLKRQELTDTFSIQEMTIETDDNNSDDSESQNLEFLPPTSNNKFLDKLMSCFYCTSNTTT